MGDFMGDIILAFICALILLAVVVIEMFISFEERDDIGILPGPYASRKYGNQQHQGMQEDLQTQQDQQMQQMYEQNRLFQEQAQRDHDQLLQTQGEQDRLFQEQVQRDLEEAEREVQQSQNQQFQDQQWQDMQFMNFMNDPFF